MSNGLATQQQRTFTITPQKTHLSIWNKLLNRIQAWAVIIPSKLLNMAGRKLLLRRRVRLALYAFELSKKLRGLECVDRKALLICTLASGQDAEALSLLQRILVLEPNLLGYGGTPLEAAENYQLDGVSKDKVQEIIGTGLLVLMYELTADYLHAKGMGNITTILGGRAFEFKDVVRPYAKPGAAAQAFLQKNNITLQELSVFPSPWTNQIGHIGMLEIMFRMREMGWWQGKAVVMARKDQVANQAFLDMVLAKGKAIVVYEEQEPALFADLSRLLNTHGRPYHVFRPPNHPWMRWHDAAALAMLTQHETGNEHRFCFRDDFDRYMDGRKSHAAFVQAMKEWGLEGRWYACLHYRRSEHDMGQANRNASLKSYISAIEYVVQHGGKVIFMGARHEGAASDISGLIDYPNTPYKSEEMDLWLIRNCKFFIGTTSGLANVAISMGIPTAQVNCLTTEYQPWNSRVRFCLKPIRRSNGTFYSQRDLTEDGRYLLATSATMAVTGLRTQDNTPEEILATVQEVNELADGCVPINDPLIDQWKRCLANKHAYGAALPALGFLRLQKNKSGTTKTDV